MKLISRELSAAVLWVASAFCVLWGIVDRDSGGWVIALIGVYVAVLAATMTVVALIFRARLERHATVEEIVRIAATVDGDERDGGAQVTRIR